MASLPIMARGRDCLRLLFSRAVVFTYFYQFPINLSGIRADVHLLFAILGLGHSQHLLLGQVAQAQESKQAQVSVVGHKVWLAPVPPPNKGKFILFGNTSIVKPLFNRRWWGRIGVCGITSSIYYAIRWLLLVLPHSSIIFRLEMAICR